MLYSKILSLVLTAAAVHSAALPAAANDLAGLLSGLNGGGAAAAGGKTITITATGASPIPAKPDGCATITPAGSEAQTVCAKKITAEGFEVSVKDVATGKKVKCKVEGTSGTCGTTGAGATISTAADGEDDEFQG